MKVTYSLQECLELVKELADKVGEPYYTVGVEINSKNGLEFRCYIHGYVGRSAKTFEESYNRLKNEIFPSLPREEDVEIEADVELTDIPNILAPIKTITDEYKEKHNL